MRLIDALTADPNQSLTFILDDGSKFNMTLSYKETQQGWFYSIVYGTAFTVNNRRLINSPNMLRQFRGFLGFGLACVVSDGHEPVFSDDFTSGRVQIYVLSSTEVQTVEASIVAGF